MCLRAPPPPRSTLFPYTTLFRSLLSSARRVTNRRRTGPLDDSRPAVLWQGNAVENRPEARCRSEEHTSELQSHSDLVCRLLLEKKNKQLEVRADPALGQILMYDA